MNGHVAGLQVRRAVRRDEAQHDVRKVAFMAASVSALAWMLTTSKRRSHACPSLPGIVTFAIPSQVFSSLCEP